MIGRTEHIEEVSRWLDENVVSYPTPRSITLSDFEIDWEQMSGRFRLTLDDHRVLDPFRFSLSQNGWVQFHPPMFTSPLGAPASYSAVELTADTEEVIAKTLKSIVPRLKPMGLDRETGLFIGQGTPVEQRITNRSLHEQAKTKLGEPDFSVSFVLDISKGGH